MAEWIGEASLSVNPPRSLMIGERLHAGGSGCGRTSDQGTGVIYKHLDPGRRQGDVGWASLVRSARHSLVQEEWRVIKMKTCDTAKVPKQIGTKGAGVPLDRRLGVRDDQHHRQRCPWYVRAHDQILLRAHRLQPEHTPR
jgi:hypothetical protein